MDLLLRKGAERRLTGRKLRSLTHAGIVEIADGIGLAGKLPANFAKDIPKGFSAG